ncbi:MAG: carboxylesterase/lipase family protein [Acidimicrobiia bacterium]|nr:carboxylesterase/lipase family protein [Acidimicrobiia bacterium]
MPSATTRTLQGRVEGERSGDVSVFRGIPYAASTSGAARFAPPRPPEPWDGVRPCRTAGPIAPQNPSALETMLGSDGSTGDEDCLSLNVFTPDCDDAGRPVMVWIHGGAFVTGTGSIPWYDGARLAARGVVVVTINYRLGALGFLHLEGIAPGFDGAGNAGLLDQIAALEWVRDNVSGFGGDPDQVTIFGESAGAMSVACLLAAPAARGLFRRAILQSGAGAHVHEPERATAVAQKFLAEAGVGPGDVDRLRELSVADLLAAQQRLSESTPFDDGLPLQPVVDGTVLVDRPHRAIGAGHAAGVDVLIGTTAEEMNLFLLMDPGLGSLDEAGLSARADARFVPAGRKPGEALAVYRQDRPDAPVRDVLCALLTDFTFRIPAIRLADAQLTQHPGVWMYLFTYRTPAFGGQLGSCHALEIPFVWDNLDARGAAMFVGEVDDGLRALATQMADAWVAFATSGVPAAPGLPEWPRYDADRRATMRFDVGAVEVLDDPGRAERELWQGLDR